MRHFEARKAHTPIAYAFTDAYAHSYADADADATPTPILLSRTCAIAMATCPDSGMADLPTSRRT